MSLYSVQNHFIAYRPVSRNHIVIIAIFRQSRDIDALVVAEADRFRKDFEEVDVRLATGQISLGIPKPKSS